MTINLLDGEIIEAERIEVKGEHLVADDYYYILVSDIDTIEG